MTIDSLLEYHGNIFTGSAEKTFGTYNCKNNDGKTNKNKNGQNLKPWFDNDCTGLGAIRAKIGPTSDVDKIFSKMYSQYVLFRNKYS